jgi:hypothetical protein
MAEAGYLVDSNYGNLNPGLSGDNSFNQSIGNSDPIITYAEVLKVENGLIYISPRNLDQSTIFRGGNRSQQPTINILNSDVSNIPRAGDTIIVLFDGTDYDYIAKSQKTIGVGQEKHNFLNSSKNNSSASQRDQNWGIKQIVGKSENPTNDKLLQSPNIMEAPYHNVPNVVYNKNAFNIGLWNHMLVFEKFGASISLNETYESGSLIGWSNHKHGWYPQVFTTNDFWGRSLWNNSNNSTEKKPETLTWKDQWNNCLIGYNNYIASTMGSTHVYSSNNISFTAEENISIDSRKSTRINSDIDINLTSKKIELIGDKINLVSLNASKSSVLGEDLVQILNEAYRSLVEITRWMQTHSHPQLGVPSPNPVSPISSPDINSILSKHVKLN